MRKLEPVVCEAWEDGKVASGEFVKVEDTGADSRVITLDRAGKSLFVWETGALSRYNFVVGEFVKIVCKGKTQKYAKGTGWAFDVFVLDDSKEIQEEVKSWE